MRDNERFVVESIHSRETGDTAVAVSTTRLHNIAGKYTGKDDPVMLVRVQGNFPATGEVLSPFNIDEVVKSLNLVTPAKAGVQKCLKLLDSGSSPE